MSHATGAQPATQPAANQNPLSASEPWNLVADNYAETSMLVFEQFADEAFPTGCTSEFRDNRVKGSAPIQMKKKSMVSVRGEMTVRGLAEVLAPSGCEPVEPHSENMGEALWREKEKLALAWLEEALPTLKRPLTLDAWLGLGEK